MISRAAGAAAVLSMPALAGAQPFHAELVASGLSRPVAVVAAPGVTDRAFIVEQRSSSTGRVRVLDLNTDTLLPTPALSVSGVSTASEQGLLGLAFDPDYATNGYVYVNYTTNSGGNQTRVVRYTRSAANPDVFDPATATRIMTVAQPDSNHNGGWIDFGPDGYLYVAMGDGGSGNDPWGAFGNGQNQATKLGTMLRIDPDGDDFPADPNNNYAIPSNNPFVGQPGADEAIWAWGLRNPWRNDFDPQTGDLFIADVGQFFREEVNFQPASSVGGENYGWRKWEGTRLNFAGDPGPDAADAVFPVTEYTHSAPDNGCSITGGVVVRSQTLPDLWGEFIFGDYCSGKVYALRDTTSGWVREEITNDFTFSASSFSGISSFGRDSLGRVYVCSLFNGSVFRITQPGICGLADINEDGVLNVDDIDALVAAFLSSDPDADLDQNGAWNVDDIDLFVSSFLGGCP
ncbi:MAG: PQQ-dependent sugar dehydrogenase [Phycisphaerales bacterium]